MTSIERIDADLHSHRIEGVAAANPAAGRFSVPLISHIDGNLWTGGCINGVRLPDDFKHVVSLYPWERYELGPGTQRTEVRMLDATELLESDTLYAIADGVAANLRDGKTLVHCQAGLNRSGLIAALALTLDGRDPADAIALLRERRSPMVLCNQTFENWLLTHGLRDLAA